jgi:hypothetical protein
MIPMPILTTWSRYMRRIRAQLTQAGESIASLGEVPPPEHNDPERNSELAEIYLRKWGAIKSLGWDMECCACVPPGCQVTLHSFT